MIKSVGVFVALWGMVASLTANAQSANYLRDSAMRREGAAFIARMPEGLQARQEKAVRMAIAGNCTLLEEVRASRNGVETLPDEVRATDIQGKYRLYAPVLSSSKKLPLLIYLHGGGWCFGSINSCSRFCMELVREAGVAVLAVEYPLAPEHPYPAALTCCTEAVSFAFNQAEAYGFDTENISIGGDSAGGNLALATALHLVYARQMLAVTDSASIPRLRSIVAFYPVTKVWNDRSDSWRQYGQGYGLDGSIMEAFNEAYLQGANPDLPLISPYNAPLEHLAQFPSVLMINAEKDILCEQGRQMCDKLTEAGVDVVHEVLPGTTHLFITVAGQPTAFGKAVRATSEFLKRADR